MFDPDFMDTSNQRRILPHPRAVGQQNSRQEVSKHKTQKGSREGVLSAPVVAQSLPDKTEMDTQGAMHSGAVNTQKYTIRDAGPTRALGATVETSLCGRGAK